MALLRDIHFQFYGANALAHAAADDLNRLSDYRGPKDRNGHVTPAVLFRGIAPGDLKGPYISQFLLTYAPFGANTIEQLMRTTLPGVDYATRFEDWVAVQNGVKQRPNVFGPLRRYTVNGRDLGQWVHVDVLFQAHLMAFLVMLDMGFRLTSVTHITIRQRKKALVHLGGRIPRRPFAKSRRGP
jgi:hypothetical protein